MGSIRTTEGARIWTHLHLLALFALLLRLAVALISERISYPDELFQYLEQAHRYTYGYGFETWEYRYGIRNWLLPGFLSGLLGLFSNAGLDSPKAYIPAIKSVAAALSVSVVYASYFLGRSLFSEKTARIAAVLSTIWHEPLYYSVVATPEVMGGYALLGAAALATCRRQCSALQAIGIGTLVGLPSSTPNAVSS